MTLHDFHGALKKVGGLYFGTYHGVLSIMDLGHAEKIATKQECVSRE